MIVTATNNKKSALKKLMRGLLAGTCLTAGSAAYATTINETTDFSNTLAGAVAAPLPFGTDIVNGTAAGQDIDFVDFQGLLAGGAFTVQFNSFAGTLNFSIFNSSGVQIGSTANFATAQTFTGTTPGDGQLVAQVAHDEGSTYRIALTAPQATATPEPATSALIGLGLAAAGAVEARRRKLLK